MPENSYLRAGPVDTVLEWYGFDGFYDDPNSAPLPAIKIKAELQGNSHGNALNAQGQPLTTISRGHHARARLPVPRNGGVHGNGGDTADTIKTRRHTHTLAALLPADG